MFVNQIVPENEFKQEPSNSGFFVCKTNIPLSCFKNDVKSIQIPRNMKNAFQNLELFLTFFFKY